MQLIQHIIISNGVRKGFILRVKFMTTLIYDNQRAHGSYAFPIKLTHTNSKS
jgi:hypothetical protein